MLHRTCRSAAILLSVLGVLWTGPGGGLVTRAMANDLALRFEDIEAFATATSPRARINAQEFTAAAAAGDLARQWSNPALAYDHEAHDSFREWQFTLGKRFERPFAQSSARASAQQRIRAAELRADQAEIDLVTDLKGGYVRLRLFDAQLGHLARLAELVDLAATVAGNRHREGDLSGVESELVQLASFSVGAELRRVQQEQRRLAAGWRTEMGIAPEVTVTLVTPVGFQSVALADPQEYVSGLARRPGHLAQAAVDQALGLEAAASRPSLVPGLNVYGGYKQYAGDDNGIVAGVALDLPLFDRSAPASRRLAAEQAIVRYELAMELARTHEEITNLVDVINGDQTALAAFTTRRAGRTPLVDALLDAYRAGALGLDALLGAIQIEAAAMASYYENLVAHYLNIFRLEAVTGAALVTFAP